MSSIRTKTSDSFWTATKNGMSQHDPCQAIAALNGAAIARRELHET